MKDRARFGKWVRAHVWEHIVVPLGEAQFYMEGELELAHRLGSSDAVMSERLLNQAQSIDANQHQVAESIEARAMTLQGAVAIATTLAIAAGGLLVDRSKVSSAGWRITFSVVVLSAVLAFIASGLRALQASSTTFPWAYPGFNDIFDHAAGDVRWARARAAASHLKAAGDNLRIVQVKGGYLNAAVGWFRIALALLAALAITFVAYAIWGSVATAQDHRIDHHPLCRGAPHQSHRWSSCNYRR
jgi:hypothetical protein